MEAFATIDQYEDSFGPVSDPVMLERKLETASRAIRRALKANGIDYSDPDEEFAGDLMDVCCSVTNRLMPSGIGSVSSYMVSPGAISLFFPW